MHVKTWVIILIKVVYMEGKGFNKSEGRVHFMGVSMSRV